VYVDKDSKCVHILGGDSNTVLLLSLQVSGPCHGTHVLCIYPVNVIQFIFSLKQ